MHLEDKTIVNTTLYIYEYALLNSDIHRNWYVYTEGLLLNLSNIKVLCWYAHQVHGNIKYYLAENFFLLHVPVNIFYFHHSNSQLGSIF